jgi:glycosyltransferase involved in cell wall biosynthesis
MDLSVIIPAYNAESTIGELLDSLIQQKWNREWEIVIANNGSKDRTVEIIKSYDNKFKNLSIIDASMKKGPSFARNEGAKQSKGKYLVFVDSDDVVGHNFINIMGKSLDQYEFVASRIEYTRLNTPSMLKIRSGAQSKGLQEYTWARFFPHAMGTGLGIRREIHEEVSGFDEDIIYLQDTDYCWKIQVAGYTLHYMDDAVIHLRLRDTVYNNFYQAMTWGEDEILLYKRYTDKGMEKRSLKIGILDQYKFFKKSWVIFYPQERGRWVRNFGRTVGRLKGAIKYRVVVL